MYNYYSDCLCGEKNFFTDLASERRRADADERGIEYERSECQVGSWERVRIVSEEGEQSILRPMGTYDTLNCDRLDKFDEDGLLDIQDEIAKKLCSLLDENDIFPGRILVAGFGNGRIAADSIGSKAATRVKPTLHISDCDPSVFDKLECSEIAVFLPSVPALCGMNSCETLRAISEKIIPDVIIAVDSVMTKSSKRLGASIQFSSTGLFPGGIGNLASPITKGTMGYPVIGIGVPTVMDSNGYIPSGSKGEHLYVMPREIDDITDNAAFVIGGAINQAFGINYF